MSAMAEQKQYTFNEFKQALVALAIDRSLPNDLGELAERDLFPETTGKLIGYQVVTKATHVLHPDMGASFCVYSKDQAEKMWAQDIARYVILPVHDGEIEDPTLMYEGDSPND